MTSGMDLFVGQGSAELFDPAFRHQILLEVVGCTGLERALHPTTTSSSTKDASQQDKDAPATKNKKQANKVASKKKTNHKSKNADHDTLDDDHDNEEEEEEDDAGNRIHPYCVVQLAQLVVHKTKALRGGDPTTHFNPIWTILTKSLCVLEIPTVQALDESVPGSPRRALGFSEHESHKSILETGLSLHVWQSHPQHVRLGTIALTLDQVRAIALTQPGERLEFPLHVEQPQQPHDTHPKEAALTRAPSQVLDASSIRDGSATRPPIVALRMRLATVDDLIQLGKHAPLERSRSQDDDDEDDNDATNGLPSNLPTNTIFQDWTKQAADLEFKEVRIKSIFQSYKKTVHGVKHYRVMPGPDPFRPTVETEWMTKTQILDRALHPSYHFVHVGTGTVGKCFVEILGANELPNMDLSVSGDNRTDPFVAMVFEDCMVRTDMLWDELNPRWMPWTMRAFCFHIRHPQSLLLLGVFDYDEPPLESHDAVGRICINLAHFYPDTTYLLHYDLQHDPRFPPHLAGRGQVQLRLRVEWTNEVEMHKLSFTAPPKCILNCKTDKCFQVLRYLKRGPVDMETSSMETIKVYCGEVAQYWRRYCHFLDILFEVFLWRGRLPLWNNPAKDQSSPHKVRTIWFPLHSMALSVAVLTSLEYPRLIGPMFLYAIAWILLTINYHNSRHPYPWKRCKKWMESNYAVWTGRPLKRRVRIPAMSDDDEAVRAAHRQELVDEWRGTRMSALIGATLSFYNQMYQIYSTTSVTAKFFSTKQSGWTLFGSKLTYPHMVLKYLCKYSRLYLGFLNWDGYGAHSVVWKCLVVATLWLFLPVNAILLWVCRILAWTLLGPWMKLVDIYWIHSWYKTSDELADLAQQGVQDPGPDLPNYNAVLQSGWLKDMAYNGRLVAEHALKLKDMRDYRFGRYSEFIPALDESQYPSIPLPQSTAEPFVPPPTTRTSSSNSSRMGATQRAATAHMALPKRLVVGQKLRGSMIMEPDSSRPSKHHTHDNHQSNNNNNTTSSNYQDPPPSAPPATPPRTPPGHVSYTRSVSGAPPVPDAQSPTRESSSLSSSFFSSWRRGRSTSGTQPLSEQEEWRTSLQQPSLLPARQVAEEEESVHLAPSVRRRTASPPRPLPRDRSPVRHLSLAFSQRIKVE